MSALGRTNFELNSTSIVEFSSIEVGNSVADFTVHPEKKMIKIKNLEVCILKQTWQTGCRVHLYQSRQAMPTS